MANTNSFSPNIIIRALWFILLGWGLTGLWLAIAWILNVLVIFLPIGLKMISLTPKVLTLKRHTQKTTNRRWKLDLYQDQPDKYLVPWTLLSVCRLVGKPTLDEYWIPALYNTNWSALWNLDVKPVARGNHTFTDPNIFSFFRLSIFPGFCSYTDKSLSKYR